MTSARGRPPVGQPATAAADLMEVNFDDTTTRTITPFGGWGTHEVVAFRDRLARWWHATAPDDPCREGIGDLLLWATVELGERLAAFARLAHADGFPAHGAALEALAYDAAITEVRR